MASGNNSSSSGNNNNRGGSTRRAGAPPPVSAWGNVNPNILAPPPNQQPPPQLQQQQAPPVTRQAAPQQTVPHQPPQAKNPNAPKSHPKEQKQPQQPGRSNAPSRNPPTNMNPSMQAQPYISNYPPQQNMMQPMHSHHQPQMVHPHHQHQQYARGAPHAKVAPPTDKQQQQPEPPSKVQPSLSQPQKPPPPPQQPPSYQNPYYANMHTPNPPANYYPPQQVNPYSRPAPPQQNPYTANMANNNRQNIGLWQPSYPPTTQHPNAYQQHPPAQPYHPAGGLPAHHAMGGMPQGSHYANPPKAYAPPPARVKTVLKITNKKGEVIDITGESNVKKLLPDKLSAGTGKKDEGGDVGSIMKALAQQALEENVNTRQKREEEEKKKSVVEEEKRAEDEKIEQERVAQLEIEAKKKAEIEAKAEAEKQAAEKLELEAIAKAEREAKEKVELEAKAKKEMEAKLTLEKEFKEKAEKEAKERAERGVREKLELVARVSKERDARDQAREQAKQQVKPTPPPRSGTLRPGSSSLRPGSSSLRPGGSGAGLRPGGGGLRPGGKGQGKSVSPIGAPTSVVNNIIIGERIVYSKESLLGYKDHPKCQARPPSLPDMTIRSNTQNRPNNNNSNHGSKTWDRGQSNPNQNQGQNQGQNQNQPEKRNYRNNNDNKRGGGGQWSRGHEAPPQNRNYNQKGGNRNNRNQPPPPDANCKPLEAKGENAWRPEKSSNAMTVTAKLVKSILNKMTKEKFDTLSTKFIDIPVISYEMLTMMIHAVYEKAIAEPAFADMYSLLCLRLAERIGSTEFVHTIPSDGKGWRWSNDVSVDDSEILGPFQSGQECKEAALGGEKEDMKPIQRGDMELKLVSLVISDGIFIKTLQPKDDEDSYYVVFFPVEEHEKCGQQLSEIFSDEKTCQADVIKRNSFKRTLLNKCEDEFNQQDIYEDWKIEKKAYNIEKSKLSQQERALKEEGFEFRRLKIKKHYLGNIKFIGELYKQSMIRENIMHYCICSLLKIKEIKGVGWEDIDEEMDVEDHEALSHLITTVGKTMDKEKNKQKLRKYFTSISVHSDDEKLPSRSRFMYKDLIDLRKNYWKPRMEKETAKTLDEIRKQAEREEYQAQQQSQQQGGYGGRGGGNRDSRGGRGGGDYRSAGSMRSSASNYTSSRRLAAKAAEVDKDGFAVVEKGRAARPVSGQTTSSTPSRGATSTSKRQSSSSTAVKKRTPTPATPAAAPKPVPPQTKNSSTPPPMDKDKLKNSVKNMKNEFIAGKITEDLLYSFDQFSGTPKGSESVVEVLLDMAMECNDKERAGIIALFLSLFEHSKLTKNDVESGSADTVEFVDGFVADCPHAVKNLGEVVAVFVEKKMMTVSWLCDSASKCFEKKCAVELGEAMVKSLKGRCAKEWVSILEPNAKDLKELIGEQKWKDIQS